MASIGGQSPRGLQSFGGHSGLSAGANPTANAGGPANPNAANDLSRRNGIDRFERGQDVTNVTVITINNGSDPAGQPEQGAGECGPAPEEQGGNPLFEQMMRIIDMMIMLMMGMVQGMLPQGNR